MPHVTIIGGGIAGLATAYYLQKQSGENGTAVRYILIEMEPRLGGKIITDQTDDFVIEGGPDSFITQKPWASQLCRELGLTSRLIPTNDERRNIYVLQKGKLVPFPGGYRLTVPTEFVPFVLSPLISPLGKLRMALDLLIPARRAQGDESLADFIRRRLGREALDKIAAPVMAGIYVADPERLSLLSTFPAFAEMEQKHGSLIKAMRAAGAPPNSARLNGNTLRSKSGGPPAAMFTSLRGGMQELVEALTAQLEGDLLVNSRVTSLRASAPGFEIAVSGPTPQKLHTDAVVLAVPAPSAALLVEPIQPRLAGLLKTIRYVSTATVSLGYRRADLSNPLNGFGFMVPKSENRQILACTWSSTKFDNRAPAEAALLRLFVGGEGQEHLVEDWPDQALFDLAQAEVAAIMGICAQPVLRRIFRWPKGNPQYDVGHLERVAEMEQIAATLPGFYLTGSAFRGIGLPDCIKGAQAVAEQLLQDLAQPVSMVSPEA